MSSREYKGSEDASGALARERDDALRDESAKLSWGAMYRDGETAGRWATLPFIRPAAKTFADHALGPILEVPCGGGSNTTELACRVPLVVAVDSSPMALSVAHKTLEAEGLRNCILLSADIFTLPFPAAQFGGVLCADLLGHLRRPAEAMKELARVTRSGGSVVMNFPTADDSTRSDPLMERIGAAEYLFRDEVYFRYYDEAGVDALIRSVGMSAVEIAMYRWIEDPHPGYRDYEHAHESIVVTAQV